jgi:hypothetical protein
VPHLRDSFIVAKVGIRKANRILSSHPVPEIQFPEERACRITAVGLPAVALILVL